ncbi:MAG: DUF2071 domain-containing protein [Dehalococcoidia bacterium]
MTSAERGPRPRPAPRGPWVVAQTWNTLLFSHWPVPADLLRSLVPPALDLDTYDGETWVSIVAFRMSDVRFRLFPGLPGLTAYPQINVRTYVVRDRRPGVYFLGIETASGGTAALARRWFGLPYHHARIAVEEWDGAIRYAARRAARWGPPAEFRAWCRPGGAPAPASPGSLDEWLAERYACTPPAGAVA